MGGLWLAAGLVLIVSCAGWTYLSGHFQYGEGHAGRPILEVLLLYGTTWLGFVVSFRLLKTGKGKSPLLFILGVGLLARVLVMPSNLIQENDVYRYVLDGQALLHGQNPYQYSPLVVREFASPEFKLELESAPARTVLSRIGYPHIPTIYPPAAQVAFAAGGLIGEWDWMGQRWVFLLFDMATLGLLLLLLKSLALSLGWIALYAWNPLVLKEVINSAHLDIMVAFFLIAAIAGFVQWDKLSMASDQAGANRAELARNGWIILAAAALGLAILSKVYPIVLLPACLIFLGRRSLGPGAPLIFAAVTGLVVFLGILPFDGVGIDQLTTGLRTYASEWLRNEGVFALLGWWASDPRLLAAGIIAAFSVAVPVARAVKSTPRPGPADATRSVLLLAGDFQWILLFWLLFLPSPFPWYGVPLAALLVLRFDNAAAVATLMLSGAVALYYLVFFYEYQDYPRVWWTWTRIIEHALIWISMTLPLILRKLGRGRSLTVAARIESSYSRTEPRP